MTLYCYSEPMWPIEARNAAIANTYFVACNNRIGRVSVSPTYIMIFIVHVILIALLYCKYFVYNICKKRTLMSLLLLMENLVILKYLSY